MNSVVIEREKPNIGDKFLALAIGGCIIALLVSQNMDAIRPLPALVQQAAQMHQTATQQEILHAKATQAINTIAGNPGEAIGRGQKLTKNDVCMTLYLSYADWATEMKADNDPVIAANMDVANDKMRTLGCDKHPMHI